MDRSRREPSQTTTMSGSPKEALLPFCLADFCRASRSWVSSPIRAPTVSASVPMRTFVSWAPAGLLCGSQRTQSQSSWPLFSVRT